MNERQKFIGNAVDTMATKKLRLETVQDEKRLDRKRKERESLERRRAEQCTPSSSIASPSDIDTTGTANELSSSLSEMEISDQTSPPKAKRTRIDCPRTMEVMARYNIPVRVAHMLLNSHSLDLKDAFSLDVPNESLMMGRTQVQNQFNN